VVNLLWIRLGSLTFLLSVAALVAVMVAAAVVALEVTCSSLTHIYLREHLLVLSARAGLAQPEINTRIPVIMETLAE